MEALLREAGEGLGRGGLGENDNTCRSVGELKSRIAALFSGKVSETHAEHVSASFDVPADVVLNLGEATSMQQNDGSLDGTGASSDPEVTAVRGGAILGGVVRNFVTVREVVMSQPETNPLLQRAVAAFLIIQVRQADGSMWAAQEPTRATQGWTVAYACQNSMACWHHAHKRQRVVGLSALEDMQDPLSLARPAYDCRGVVVISFSRFSRSVVVKYEHTNFHRSVSQLAAMFPPPRPPSPIALLLATPSSTNKRQKTTASGELRKKRQKKAPAPAADGAEAAAAGATADGAVPEGGVASTGQALTVSGKPKKPRKPRKPSEIEKKNGETGEGTGADANANGGTGTAAGGGESISAIASAAADMMMDLGIDVGHDADLSENQVAEALLRHLNDYPEDSTETAAAMMDALVEHSSASDANWQLTRESAAAAAVEPGGANNAQATATAGQTTTGDASATNEVRDAPYEKVTEAEVSTLRKLTAITLLTSRNVDPATLTHDQFCTFANQAPVLQKESLELLAHYGAERLAIVPAEKKANNNTRSPSPAPAAAATTTTTTATPSPANTALPATNTSSILAATTTASATPAKKPAAKKPAKKRQSKDAAAADSATAMSTTGVSLPGLRGTENNSSNAGWSDTQSTSTLQAPQHQTAVPLPQQATESATPIPAAKPTPQRWKSTTSRARQSTSAADSVQTPTQTHVTPTQVSPVPLPMTAYPQGDVSATTSAAAADTLAKAPTKKPRAPRKKKDATPAPAAQPSPMIRQSTNVQATAYNTGTQDQQSSNYYNNYQQTTQRQQQQQYSHWSTNSSAQRGRQAVSVLSPPLINAQQTTPSHSAYNSRDATSYNTQATNAVAGQTTDASTGYNQYGGHGRNNSGSGASGTAAVVTTTATNNNGQAATANTQIAFDNYLSDYGRRTDSPVYNTSQWPAPSISGGTAADQNVYVASTTQQQHHHQQPQQQQRTTTPGAYNSLPRPAEMAGLSSTPTESLLANLDQQQQPGRQTPTSNVTYAHLLQRQQQQQQPQTRTHSPMAADGAAQQAYNNNAGSNNTAATTRTVTRASSAATNNTGYGHAAANTSNYQQPQTQRSMRSQQSQQQQQPAQQQHHQYQQPHQQQQRPQHQTRSTMGRDAYGNNQVTSEDLFEMLRRTQG